MKLLIPKYEDIYRIAADEFRSFWHAMTDEWVEAVTEPVGGEDHVVLGGDEEFPFVFELILNGTIPPFGIPIGGDSFVLRSAEIDGHDWLFLAGGRPRALLYAVYAFFEHQGCSYFPDGDRIPKCASLSLKGFDLYERNRFQYRMIRYFAHRGLKRFQAEFWDFEDWKREIDFLVKRRFNLFMLRIGMDDLFQKAFPDIVPYPENGRVPESIPHSYNDRNLFWSLEYRGTLRRKILAYARERDLLHPEDVGVVTHWYSRTPQAYLDQAAPRFIPQAGGAYYEPTGRAWDIRDRKNLEAYFKLTETHIREYGSPDIFHTIGLAERMCFPERRENLAFKLYVYRSIISELRKRYPNAPLLIGTWDFSTFWTPEEVTAFIGELDPGRNLIFDYTSDTDDPVNYFMNWGVVRKFPWIFGIFSAYESETDLRGDYTRISERLKIAAADPECRGFALWPECSHSDILLMEYVCRNSWKPEPEQGIRPVIDALCRSRYSGEMQKVMHAVWLEALPVIESRFFIGPVTPRGRMGHEIIFNVLHVKNYRTFTPENLTAHRLTAETMRAAECVLPDLLCTLAAIGLPDEVFVCKDLLDLAKTTLGRALHIHLTHLMLDLEHFRSRISGAAESARSRLALIESCYEALRDVLACSGDFSLNHTLHALERSAPVYPDFVGTLKADAGNHYCRSYVYELFDMLYLPEFRLYRNYTEEKILREDRGIWDDAEARFPELEQQTEAFYYSAALPGFAPNLSEARRHYKQTMKSIAYKLKGFLP